MNKRNILLILPVLLSISCNKDNGLKVICPYGAPSICFYSEASNDNFLTSPVNAISPQFQNKNSEYDMLVIDSITGLTQTSKYDSKFKFAKLLTSGNLYFSGLKGNDINPNKDSKIVAFGQESLTGLVFNKLIDSNTTWKSWNINKDNIIWFNQVSDLAPIIKNGSYGGITINYALIAEPLKYTLSNYLSNSFNVSLKQAWKEYSGSDEIPQAALFINNDSWTNKKDKVKEYISKIDKNITTAISNPKNMKEELDKYGSEDKVAARFNFTSNIAYEVMKNNNGYALYSSKEEYGCDKINAFLEKLDSTKRFDKKYFININD